MTSGKIYLAALLAVAMTATPVCAQTSTSTSGGTNTSSSRGGTSSTGSTGSTTGTSSTTGRFQSLSPGEQKIARALFEAQQPSADGPAPLSLDQIAARKSGTGWGQVFQQMKSEGLVDAKNMGQVVSGHTTTNGSVATTASSGGTGTVATSANGRPVAAGKSPTSTAGGAQGHGDSAHVSDASVATSGGDTGAHGGGASNVHAR